MSPGVCVDVLSRFNKNRMSPTRVGNDMDGDDTDACTDCLNPDRFNICCAARACVGIFMYQHQHATHGEHTLACARRIAGVS